MDRSLFFAQVDLLLRILPYVMRDSRFALKAGSVLNKPKHKLAIEKLKEVLGL